MQVIDRMSIGLPLWISADIGNGTLRRSAYYFVRGQAALPRFDFPLGNRLGVFKIGQRDKCFIGRVKQIPDVKTNAVYRFNGVLGSMNLTTHLLSPRHAYSPNGQRCLSLAIW
jgi:hypothetical protein